MVKPNSGSIQIMTNANSLLAKKIQQEHTMTSDHLDARITDIARHYNTGIQAALNERYEAIDAVNAAYMSGAIDLATRAIRITQIEAAYDASIERLRKGRVE